MKTDTPYQTDTPKPYTTPLRRHSLNCIKYRVLLSIIDLSLCSA